METHLVVHVSLGDVTMKEQTCPTAKLAHPAHEDSKKRFFTDYRDTVTGIPESGSHSSARGTSNNNSFITDYSDWLHIAPGGEPLASRPLWS
jgi:hypothetical protein